MPVTRPSNKKLLTGNDTDQMRRDNSTAETPHLIPSPRVFPLEDADLQRWEALLIGNAVPERVVLHKYSPAIAKLLNPKQPDIAGAVLLRNISLRQKLRCSEDIIKGGRFASRSLNDLSKDCPYLSRSAAHKALHRLQRKLGDNFTVRRPFSSHWYAIGEDVLRIQKEDGLVCFNPADASFHGNIRTAVILHRMKCAMSDPEEWIRDEHGNRYVNMSPGMLSKALGYSPDTINRCMRGLCQDKKLLSRHPEHPLWYTFTSMKEDVAPSIFANVRL